MDHLEKHIVLLKATLVMAKCPELSQAKKKLREIFSLEIFHHSFQHLYYLNVNKIRKQLYTEDYNDQVLAILKLVLQNYGEVYLREKHDNFLIRKKINL